MVVDGDPLQALSDIPTRHAASAQAAAERLDGEGSRHLQQKVSCGGAERQRPPVSPEGGVAKHARQPALVQMLHSRQSRSTVAWSWSAALHRGSHVRTRARSLGRFRVTGQQEQGSQQAHEEQAVTCVHCINSLVTCMGNC